MEGEKAATVLDIKGLDDSVRFDLTIFISVGKIDAELIAGKCITYFYYGTRV